MDQIFAIMAAAPKAGYGQWESPGLERDSPAFRRFQGAMQTSLGGDRKVPAVLNDDEIRVLRIEETTSTKGIALARDLVNCPYGRFDVTFASNFWSTNFSHVGGIRTAANLLRYDAPVAC